MPENTPEIEKALQDEMNELIAKFQASALAALADPVSEQSRKLRRVLLGFSALAILVAEARLVPKKINALGLNFQDIDQIAFVNVSALVVAFLAASFVVHAISELYSLAIKVSVFSGDIKTAAEKADDWFAKKLRRTRRRWNRAIAMRCVWEFLVPFLIGLYAAYALYSAELPVKPC